MACRLLLDSENAGGSGTKQLSRVTDEGPKPREAPSQLCAQVPAQSAGCRGQGSPRDPLQTQLKNRSNPSTPTSNRWPVAVTKPVNGQRTVTTQIVRSATAQPNAASGKSKVWPKTSTKPQSHCDSGVVASLIREGLRRRHRRRSHRAPIPLEVGHGGASGSRGSGSQAKMKPNTSGTTHRRFLCVSQLPGPRLGSS